jgi:hypothetical protein
MFESCRARQPSLTPANERVGDGWQATRRCRPERTEAPKERRWAGRAFPSSRGVLDNLREGVVAPDIYDPSLNPLYRDVLAHYGVVALSCRVGDPDRKGKVEACLGNRRFSPGVALSNRMMFGAGRLRPNFEQSSGGATR